ncbi:MAG: hypothetical protein U9Q89_03185 [Thermodesulfobacteriota bacterium]|nr:hypothetical protein [Thermodesulfobacteriota bacterium]
MDIKQITASLKQIFEEYKKRIVFWYDREGEFSEIGDITSPIDEKWDAADDCA